MAAQDTQAGEQVDLRTQSLARPAALMAVGTALSRLTGLGRVVAMAYALGVAESRLADAYNLANTLPNVLYELVLGGVLTSVFIPVLVGELRSKPPEEAWRTISAIFTVAVGVLVALSILAIAAAPVIIDLFTGRAPKGSHQGELATFLLRVFAPQIALYGFAALAQGLLNAHGRFVLPMFAPILNNVAVIATFIAFALIVKGTPTDASVVMDSTQKWLLAAGTTGGVAAMAIALAPALFRLPVARLRPHFDFKHPVLRRLGKLSAWTLVYVITNSIGFAVSFYLAGALQGGVTAYTTAFAFFQLPIGIAAISVVSALLPKLSALASDGADREFSLRLAGGLKLVALMMLPATAALVILGGPLVKLLLEHGVVSGHSEHLVATTLAWFSVGLLPFAAFQLLMRAFYARQDAKTPALVNLWENAVTIVLDIALYPFMDVRGLALAHGLGYVAGCLIAWRILARRVHGFGDRALATELARITVATAVAAVVMLAAYLWLNVAFGGDLAAFTELVVGGGLGLTVFVLAAYVLKVEELDTFARVLPARVRVRLGISA